MTDDEVAREYAALFGGVGKPEVYLFGSHYLSGFLNEKPLARLRTDLAALGLARDEAMPETEDHIAYLCEVMRYLIAGEDVAVANLARQSEFFATHLQPWVTALCDAIAAHPKARFYAALAGFYPFFHRRRSAGLRHAGRRGLRLSAGCRVVARHDNYRRQCTNLPVAPDDGEIGEGRAQVVAGGVVDGEPAEVEVAQRFQAVCQALAREVAAGALEPFGENPGG
jgi:hypothetical protein